MTTRPATTFLTIAGESRTLVDWARIANISRQIVLSRLKQGWKPADAVFRPRVFVMSPKSHRPIRETEPVRPAVRRVANPLRPTWGGFASWDIAAIEVLRRCA